MASNSIFKNKRNNVEEPIKEQGIWIFANVECRVDNNVIFTWTSLFQAFQDKEFQVLLQVDQSIELRKEIYRNIIKSRLHWEAIRTSVLPCPDVIKWITWRVEHENREILNFKDKSVASYKASVLNQIYHFKEAHVKVTPEWLKQKNDSSDSSTIMKGWWYEGQFRAKSASIEWKTSKFRKIIQIIVIFLSRVFRRKDGSSFPDKWIPIIYQVITSGSTLSWGEIISSNLGLQLKKYHKEHRFFMSSYLLYVMCVSIECSSLGWKWEANILSVHIYYKMLWENKYKDDYELIRNGFFSTLYQVLLSEEEPCLSPEGKKIVNEYVDWYMTLDGLYISIVNSTKPPHWLPHFVPHIMLLQEIPYQT